MGARWEPPSVWRTHCNIKEADRDDPELPDPAGDSVRYDRGDEVSRGVQVWIPAGAADADDPDPYMYICWNSGNITFSMDHVLDWFYYLESLFYDWYFCTLVFYVTYRILSKSQR